MAALHNMLSTNNRCGSAGVLWLVLTRTVGSYVSVRRKVCSLKSSVNGSEAAVTQRYSTLCVDDKVIGVEWNS